MLLTKFEQSGFLLETKSGFRLAIDIGNKTPIEKLENLTVDAFIVSHVHGDHFSLPHIKALTPQMVYLTSECRESILEPQTTFDIEEIKAGQVLTMGGITVTVFDVDHGPNISAPLAGNFGFLINADDQIIYFAGDMFYESGVDVSGLSVDYALIPVGGFYTFGPEKAFTFIQKFKSIKKVVPMHYDKTPETKDRFTALAADGL
jgi:L-ascorbate metabolism protein UlaG (beta-lactamase superfamily)